MVGPEAAGANSASWIEGIGAVAIFFLTLGTQAYAYIKASNAPPEAPKHMVLEAAELADMQPVREIVKRLDKVLEMEADIVEMKRASDHMLAILERMDRQAELRALLREQKAADDERQRRS